MADPGSTAKAHWLGAGDAAPILPKPRSALLPAILTVRRHGLPVTACKRAIVVPDIADAPIDIGEGCPLFPSIGNTADGC
jgi:hypothetical protein